MGPSYLKARRTCEVGCKLSARPQVRLVGVLPDKTTSLTWSEYQSLDDCNTGPYITFSYAGNSTLGQLQIFLMIQILHDIIHTTFPFFLICFLILVYKVMQDFYHQSYPTEFPQPASRIPQRPLRCLVRRVVAARPLGRATTPWCPTRPAKERPTRCLPDESEGQIQGF